MAETNANAPVANAPWASTQDVLLDSLTRFYAAEPAHMRALTDVLGDGGDVGGAAPKRHGTHTSLRLLDWLVTNYAKKRNIVYTVSHVVSPGHVERRVFNMFLEYKSQLKAYSKRFFDPFCRRERLQFAGAPGPDGAPTVLATTVGQLNFFRWALLNGVVDYVAEHGADIEADMTASTEHRRGGADRGSAGTPRHAAAKGKRRELSRAAIKGCTKTHVRVVVSFR